MSEVRQMSSGLESSSDPEAHVLSPALCPELSAGERTRVPIWPRGYLRVGEIPTPLCLLLQSQRQSCLFVCLFMTWPCAFKSAEYYTPRGGALRRTRRSLRAPLEQCSPARCAPTFALCCLLGSCGYWAPHTPHFTIRPCS